MDDTAGFPAGEFEVVSGALTATFDVIAAGANVSHAVVLKPLTSGMHNFVPATIKYKNPSGDELVSFLNLFVCSFVFGNFLVSVICGLRIPSDDRLE